MGLFPVNAAERVEISKCSNSNRRYDMNPILLPSILY